MPVPRWAWGLAKEADEVLMGLQLLSPGVQLGELSLPRVLEQLAALLWQESPTQLPPQPSLCRSSAPRCSTPTAPACPVCLRSPQGREMTNGGSGDFL